MSDMNQFPTSLTNGFHTSPSRSPTPEVVETPPPTPPTPTNNDRDSRESSRMLGTVKWFNAKAGYGFITRHGTAEDVFVHFSGISRKNPRHLMKSLGDGELVEFNIMATNVTGPGGRHVRGNPYVSYIPVRRTDSFASGDPAMAPQRFARVVDFGNSRIPVSRYNWRHRI